MIFEEIYKSAGLVPINEINVLKMNRMCISVDPSPNENYGNAAYFKVYNSTDPSSATEVVRVHFYDNKCEEHRGKKFFEMSKKQKEKLMQLLIMPPTNDAYKMMYNTTWEALIGIFNSVVRPQFILPLDLPIPDYTKLSKK